MKEKEPCKRWKLRNRKREIERKGEREKRKNFQ